MKRIWIIETSQGAMFAPFIPDPEVRIISSKDGSVVYEKNAKPQTLGQLVKSLNN